MSSSESNLTQLANDLRGPFDLSAERKREVQNFLMDTKYIHFGMDGKRLRTESYVLNLKCMPKASPSGNLDQYICSQLQLQLNEDPLVDIPELRNWAYIFNPMQVAPIWGIPQDKFRNISDGQKLLPFGIRYAIYVNFIDFHSVNDIFTRPMTWSNKGIQNLNTIGQKTVHPTSFIAAPVNFLDEVKTGSIFQNGEVTLELKAASLVDGVSCALIAYDAGESKLKMVMTDSEGKESVTAGGSIYKGDIHVDLATRWVRKATLDEHQVAETSVQGSSFKLDEYTVRHITLRLIGQEK